MYKISTLILFILLASCGSLSLEKTYKIEIKSDKISKVQYGDSTFNLPIKIKVYRSKKPLKLTYITNSINQLYKI